MVEKKLEYMCGHCLVKNWVVPIEPCRDVTVSHPCLVCGHQIDVVFKGVFESSLQDTKDRKE